MIKTIKKIVFSCLSILGLSLLMWIILVLNPSLSYANKTQIDFVDIYHNDPLAENTEKVILDAISIIKTSDLYDSDILIQLCLNDDKLYPKLNPFGRGPIAFAVLNKTVMNNCKVNFNENFAETKWEVNNYERRIFDLTWILAHEFTHNLQNHRDFGYVFRTALGNINWKLEGHAEYVSRQFKDDGKLKKKISKYLLEEQKVHIGLPVIDLEDGSKQILSYYKYAIVIQYLLEVEKLNYQKICEDERSIDEIFSSMLEWRPK